MENEYSITIYNKDDWSHEIHYDKSDFGDYYIYCRNKDCKVKEMISLLAPKDWLWNLILNETNNEEDERGAEVLEGDDIAVCSNI